MADDYPDGGIFRSRDGDQVLQRGPAGFLVPMPRPESDAWRPDERHRTLAAALDRHGLWAHLPDDMRAAAAADVAAGCYPLDFDLLSGHVEFFADGEALAEMGVERFLRGLAPVIERYGVVLDLETEDPSDNGGEYVVVINGIRCRVWENLEGAAFDDSWTWATTRPLTVVNRLLAVGGRSPVRAHTLYAGGNDGIVFFIEPGVAEAIRASGLLPEREIPALAADGVY
jgi:hypothetical protein